MDKGMSMRIQHNLEAEKTIKRVLLEKKKTHKWRVTFNWA